MGFISIIKKHINNYKLEQEKKKEQDFSNKRKYAISTLDHVWTNDEHDIYDTSYTINQQGNFGGYSAAEYQRDILERYKKYLSKEEYLQFDEIIASRRVDEKSNVLLESKDKIQKELDKLNKKRV
jgi:hypothetical protein